jgi:hypothetical protein
VENVIDDIAEKGTVVADQENRLVRIPEVLLQPARRFQIEVIGRLVQQQNIGSTHQLARQPEPAALSSAQLCEWLGSSFLGIEAKALQHCINSRGEGVSAFAVETLEVAIVSRQHLRRGRFADFGQHICLLRQRALEREEVGELSSTSFPDGLRATEVTVLFQERQPKPGLARDHALSWLL